MKTKGKQRVKKEIYDFLLIKKKGILAREISDHLNNLKFNRNGYSSREVAGLLKNREEYFFVESYNYKFKKYYKLKESYENVNIPIE